MDDYDLFYCSFKGENVWWKQRNKLMSESIITCCPVELLSGVTDIIYIVNEMCVVLLSSRRLLAVHWSENENVV